MFKVLTSGFLRNPTLEMEIEAPTEQVTLFGKSYRMYTDDWKHHVHLKCTNRCDANCAFCIEKCSRHDPEDADAFLDSMRQVVGQLKDQGAFRTLSVTGGEPTIFPRIQEVVDFANEVKPMLFSINSNGAKLDAIKEGSLNGWLNLSKHAICDDNVFARNMRIGRCDMLGFRCRQPNAKLRLQCVLGAYDGLGNIDAIDGFIDHYRDVADDFSFRSLIIESECGRMSPLFEKLRDALFDGGYIVEQAVQDYYVYETYKRDGVTITLSWADMFQLQRYNETHKDNFLEEIIVHPDGMVTGSWNKKTLVIRDGGM